MNKTKTLLIACAVSVLATVPLGGAFAQGQGEQRRQEQRERGQNRGDDQQRDWRNDGRNNRDSRDDRGSARDNRPGNDQNWQQRPGNRNDNNNGHYGNGNRGRGAGPDHNYYVGNRLPPVYRQRTYVVNDWRGHQLRSPPRGYQWVQNGGDYLLVAIATGVILQMILSN